MARLVPYDEIRGAYERFYPPGASFEDKEGLAAFEAALEKYILRLHAAPDEPVLKLSCFVIGHIEEDGHTLYEMSCVLRPDNGGGPPIVWNCRARLRELRTFLHDHVKEYLGPLYAASFNEAPFARHGGLPGTSSRLNAWFAKLATLLNGGALPPSLHAHVLCFLDTPLPEDAAVERFEEEECEDRRWQHSFKDVDFRKGKSSSSASRRSALLQRLSRHEEACPSSPRRQRLHEDAQAAFHEHLQQQQQQEEQQRAEGGYPRRPQSVAAGERKAFRSKRFFLEENHWREQLIASDGQLPGHQRSMGDESEEGDFQVIANPGKLALAPNWLESWTRRSGRPSAQELTSGDAWEALDELHDGDSAAGDLDECPDAAWQMFVRKIAEQQPTTPAATSSSTPTPKTSSTKSPHSCALQSDSLTPEKAAVTAMFAAAGPPEARGDEPNPQEAEKSDGCLAAQQKVPWSPEDKSVLQKAVRRQLPPAPLSAPALEEADDL
eukprot:TRINITY_DN3083_c2_g1_i1.p1 TRINITY_DN3083_c2_g1~~TRINITY_DN3083_c2_g1_i1.p1  ORF type:complete len:506 (-),score=117.75 TRINITY_DN3083_c2_g1_i1:98-1579(-)